ncbi:MAG: PASTA domain-containing protein [Bacteroidota bacterium]
MEDTQPQFNPQIKPEPKPTRKSYILAFLGFTAGVLLLIFLLDSFIMPFIVSAGNIVSVPKVTGLPTEEAVRAMEGRGLYVHTVHEQFNEKVPRGRVLNQLPYPNAEVKKGRRIYLTVSKGRETIAMPMLIGKSLRDARIALLQKGLQAGLTTYENSESLPANSIMAQSVPPGSSAPYGTTVDLVISRGSAMEAIVPTLIGLTLKEAQDLVEQSNMKIGTITYEKNETFESNTISNQFPQAGEMATGQLIINITIARE